MILTSSVLRACLVAGLLSPSIFVEGQALAADAGPQAAAEAGRRAMAQTCTQPPSLLQYVTNAVTASTVEARTAKYIEYEHPMTDGASALSQQWVDGTRKQWYIENQRGGAAMIDAGVALKNRTLVDEGMRELEWGYRRQDMKSGGFLESLDPFHSITIWVIDSARALLALQEAGTPYKDFEPRIRALVPHVEAAALWILKAENLSPGLAVDNPYTHRRWITAGALGTAGQLTGNRRLMDAARIFAAEGVSLQQADGRNPEKGGFDVSYEMADAIEGARYYTTLHCEDDAALMAQVRAMLAKTCQWEMTHMAADGSIDPTGSLRIGKEHMRDGTVKVVNYREVIEAFADTALITGDPQYEAVARRLAASQGW